jgi:protein-S-isoprenylcysteine O-methyltransferase Ste14
MFFSYSFILWAMWTNRFFSSHVRIQTDRGHYVVTDGPYRFVRHPGYAGAIVWVPATALLLGSLYALIPAAITIVLIIIRTYLEDVTLQKELPGYADYARKTRFRLVPRIW